MKFAFEIFLIIVSISSIKSIIDSTVASELIINGQINFTISKLLEYKMDISQTNEKYIHLEILGENKDNNYVLSIVDDFNKQNRIQLSQSIAGYTNLILSKEQIKNNSINIILECSDYSKCKGTIKNEFLSKIPLIENKPLFYYCTIDNMVIEFSINSTSEILNIWARGELDITTELEGAEYTKSKVDNFYFVNNTNNSKEISLKVIGNKGDYINVGYFGYIKKNVKNEINYFSSSEIIKDGYIITGFLNKKTVSQYCYNFENFTEENEEIHASGIIYNTYLDIILANYSEYKDKKMANSTSIGVIDGIEKYQYICFNLSSNNEENIYTFQIYSNNSLEKKLNILEPLNNGRFYRYSLKPSSKMAITSKNSKNFENILYYLFAYESSSKLYVAECDNYPLCSLDDINFNESSSVITLGKMGSINLKKDEKYDFSPINKYQKLYYVKCDENAKKHCIFFSLINRDDKEINIFEFSDFLGKNILKGQIDKYKISNSLIYNELNITDFAIEINYFGGEVDISPDLPKGIESSKISNLNKITLKIKVNNQNLYDSFNFKVKSSDNSYYSLMFFPDLAWGNIYGRDLYFTYGIPRLYSIPTKNSDENYKRSIFLINRDWSNILPTINFNSINCDIEVYYRGFDNSIKLIKNGNFFHRSPYIITELIGLIDIYSINILNDELSDYNNKMCQVYLTYKGNSEKESNGNYADILALDNLPQQIMFNENLTTVSYGYFHENWENDIMIKYCSKYKAKYIAKIYFSNHKREKEDSIIMGDGIIYLNYEEWENICKNQTCFIKVEISLERINFKETPEPILELSIKSLEDKLVSYIQKGQIIKDYINYQKSQYYYAEIGKNEIGYVNVHFLKGSGQIVAKIVEEGQKEENPDWKGKYVLPTKEKAALKMDTFTKKLKFSTEKYKCENKCYLIINVYSNIKADKIPMRRVYPYTIIVQSYPNNFNNTELPIISAPLDEYIIGSLENRTEKAVYDFYKFNFDLNKEKIVIDIHSAIENVLVNIGNEKPIMNESDFNFKLKDDDKDLNNVFILSKEEIITKLQNSTDLKNLTLTIALYSSKLNATIVKLPYSFSVRLSDESGKDIYRINSEYVSLRNSKQSTSEGGLYQCFYLIENDYLSDFSSLIIYVREKTHIAAKYVDYEDYLFGNINLTNFEYNN